MNTAEKKWKNSEKSMRFVLVCQVNLTIGSHRHTVVGTPYQVFIAHMVFDIHF